mmetsp:Transcript_73432/g.185164  ORF Transcript_73432/g.185164 Transcript_73432/m.185164 type:complete len:267 (-) Transcript_73432:249-1049(-)
MSTSEWGACHDAAAVSYPFARASESHGVGARHAPPGLGVRMRRNSAFCRAALWRERAPPRGSSGACSGAWQRWHAGPRAQAPRWCGRQTMHCVPLPWATEPKLGSDPCVSRPCNGCRRTLAGRMAAGSTARPLPELVGWIDEAAGDEAWLGDVTSLAATPHFGPWSRGHSLFFPRSGSAKPRKMVACSFGFSPHGSSRNRAKSSGDSAASKALSSTAACNISASRCSNSLVCRTVSNTATSSSKSLLSSASDSCPAFLSGPSRSIA